MERLSYRLNSIEVRGFRSVAYQHPLRLDFGDVTVLLGANGAGKSNIIAFFKLVENMVRGNLQFYVAKSGTNQQFLHFGPKKTPRFDAQIAVTSDTVRATYGFGISHALRDRLVICSEEVEFEENSVSTKQALPTDYNELALNNATETRLQALHSLLLQCKVYQFSDSSSLSPLRQSAKADGAHYLQAHGDNLPAFLLFLKNNHLQAYRRIVEYVRIVVPQFRDFYLEPDQGYVSLKWVDDSPNDYILTVDQLSDGAIRFIALATLLLQPAATMPFVVVIDEPELGLHPYAISQLNEMIKDAAKHAQIIVATQSPAIIDGFNPNDITIIEYDRALSSTVARKLCAADYGQWLEEYTVSELWDKNVIGGRPV